MTEQGFTLPSQTRRAKSGKPGPRDEGGPGNVRGVRYDQWNRALLPAPSDPDGPDVPWTRVTTITGLASSNEGRRIWTERKLVDGLANWPAGRAMIGTHADDPKVLDDVRKQAKERAGIHDAANYGTAWHRDFQRWCETGGWWDPKDFAAQPETERDIEAATRKVESEGLVIQRCEVLVVNEHLRVAGKLDHLWARALSQVIGGGVVTRDLLRVGDGKTGKDGATDPIKLWTTALQLSAYANMTHVFDTATKTFQRLDDVFNIDRATAYLLAVRDGVAELLELPIAESWGEFQAAWLLHKGKDRPLAVRPVGRPVVIPLPGPEIDPWEAGAGSDIWSPADNMSALGAVLTGQMSVEQASEALEAQQYPTCSICGRALGQPDDPDSVDCGGDCYGCMKEAVAPDPAMVALGLKAAGWTEQDVTDAKELDRAGGIKPHRPGDVDQGGFCNVMVERDGYGDSCGLPYGHPLHVVGPIGEGAQPEPARLPTDRETTLEEDALHAAVRDLAPLAGTGERGCSVCGRKGHRATIKGAPNPVCLGDADPAKQGTPSAPDSLRAMAERLSQPDAPNYTDAPAFAAGLPYAVADADFCDAHCDSSATAHPLRIRRNDKGSATGAYECSACGKRATVAAVRHHMTTPGLFTPTGRPVDQEEEEAAAARLQSSEPAPPPPPRRPAEPKWMGRRFSTATTRAELAELVQQCQADGAFSEPLQQVAATLWGTLLL